MTLIITRVFLFIMWNENFMLTQKSDAWHHIYTGCILVLIAHYMPTRWKTVLMSIGYALIADESIHILHVIGIAKSVDYWSWQSILAMSVCALIYMSIQYKSIQTANTQKLKS